MTSLPVTSLSVTSHPVAMLLSIMSKGTFCTTTIVRKKGGDALLGMRRTYFGNDVTSGHVTSFRSGTLPVTSLPVTHA
jgi:hypothetical protein